MKKVKITVVKMSRYQDLIDKYEGHVDDECNMKMGDTFISENALMPAGFCGSAWSSLYPYVLGLASGADDYFDGWMKEKNTAMISCADGFRPVTFYLEAETV